MTGPSLGRGMQGCCVVHRSMAWAVFWLLPPKVPGTERCQGAGLSGEGGVSFTLCSPLSQGLSSHVSRALRAPARPGMLLMLPRPFSHSPGTGSVAGGGLEHRHGQAAQPPQGTAAPSPSPSPHITLQSWGLAHARDPRHPWELSLPLQHCTRCSELLSIPVSLPLESAGAWFIKHWLSRQALQKK